MKSLHNFFTLLRKLTQFSNDKYKPANKSSEIKLICGQCKIAQTKQKKALFSKDRVRVMKRNFTAREF
jgi:hypothetical protein